jgi:lipoprotein-anchoring transpeptidase ErfK/SrfK
MHDIRKRRMAVAFAMLIILLVVIGVSQGKQKINSITKVEAFIEKSNKVGPVDPIVVDFSTPMILRSVTDNISIVPKQEAVFSWNGNKKLIITPKNYWKTEQDYQVKIKNGRNFLYFPVNKELAFQTVTYPKIKSFSPPRDSKDVLLDIEDPVEVVFDKSTKNFVVRFTVDPYANLNYKTNEESTAIELLPQVDAKKGTQYNIKIFIKHKDENDDNFHEIYQTSFITKAEAPREWDKNFALRLDQAKKFTEAKIIGGKYIDINLTSQVMIIFEQGKPLNAFIISSGKKGLETPQGSFQIYNKSPRAWSKAYGLYMPYWMAIANSGKFGIHELPEWPGGYKEGANHLGIPVSHGCVRLGVGPAKEVYDWADIGTPVIVHS